MAERKATNKYIPPDFDPKKHKSINGYHHSHPLRQRASKLKASSSSDIDDERIGSLVIRFEMPYNAICTHCSKGIAKGTRFNARKKQVGLFGGNNNNLNNSENLNNDSENSGTNTLDHVKVKLEETDDSNNNINSDTFNMNNEKKEKTLTMPIYSFVMKCYDCSGRLEIRTNPEQLTYDCVSGIKWKSQGLNISNDADVSNLDVNDTRSEMIVIGQDLESMDSMQRINHEKEDLVKAESAIPQLESIIKLNKRQENDFESNFQLRASHRQLRKSEKEACKNLGQRLGANFVNSYTLRSLLPEETLEDGIIAKQELSTRVKKRNIEGTSSASIFNASKSSQPLKPNEITKMAKELKKRKLTNSTQQEITSPKSSATCENSKWTLQRAKFTNTKSSISGCSALLQGLNQYKDEEDD
ncbi:predicted protein [Naegleria gruberi]|uniref:Predicted protein n=1 Tax=Naegleria gruberi TaxID=5762 RepID=D2VJY9_NAEGR|nr:uncharacterized protein NAEGRDRAFT_50173 [Naegleria gruberi]EFC42852.1 predicted protein [Naegleria gruberi]|eukprot:XP_002675596.1 predicted protein [Naegleria gruberi strain NEG-M]